mgnify:CR=1 FL=1
MTAYRNQTVETVLFACRSSQHTDTQNKRLLDNQNKDSRHKEAGKPVLRIDKATDSYGIGLIVIFSCSIVDDGLFCARSSFPISSETSVVANKKAL